MILSRLILTLICATVRLSKAQYLINQPTVEQRSVLADPFPQYPTLGDANACYQSYIGRRLVCDRAWQRISGRSLHQCQSYCARVTTCTGINYEPTSMVCEIFLHTQNGKKLRLAAVAKTAKRRSKRETLRPVSSLSTYGVRRSSRRRQQRIQLRPNYSSGEHNSRETGSNPASTYGADYTSRQSWPPTTSIRRQASSNAFPTPYGSSSASDLRAVLNSPTSEMRARRPRVVHVSQAQYNQLRRRQQMEYQTMLQTELVARATQQANEMRAQERAHIQRRQYELRMLEQMEIERENKQAQRRLPYQQPTVTSRSVGAGYAPPQYQPDDVLELFMQQQQQQRRQTTRAPIQIEQPTDTNYDDMLGGRSWSFGRSLQRRQQPAYPVAVPSSYTVPPMVTVPPMPTRPPLTAPRPIYQTYPTEPPAYPTYLPIPPPIPGYPSPGIPSAPGSPSYGDYELEPDYDIGKAPGDYGEGVPEVTAQPIQQSLLFGRGCNGGRVLAIDSLSDYYHRLSTSQSCALPGGGVSNVEGLHEIINNRASIYREKTQKS